MLKAPRRFVEDNRADVLQICTSRGSPRSHRSLTQDTLKTPRINTYADTLEEGRQMQVCALAEGDTWMTPYKRYLADGALPVEPEEGKKGQEKCRKIHPGGQCVSGDECTRIMAELHEGICGSHVGGRSLASKVIRAGFFWPTVKEDCARHAQRCKQCQKHADWHKAPPEELRSIYSPWPFHTWGIDILGPFPLAIRQMKYLIVAIEYFTPWHRSLRTRCNTLCGGTLCVALAYLGG